MLPSTSSNTNNGGGGSSNTTIKFTAVALMMAAAMMAAATVATQQSIGTRIREGIVMAMRTATASCCRCCCLLVTVAMTVSTMTMITMVVVAAAATHQSNRLWFVSKAPGEAEAVCRQCHHGWNAMTTDELDTMCRQAQCNDNRRVRHSKLPFLQLSDNGGGGGC